MPPNEFVWCFCIHNEVIACTVNCSPKRIRENVLNDRLSLGLCTSVFAAWDKLIDRFVWVGIPMQAMPTYSEPSNKFIL